jgi:hypothetical protein
VPATPAIVRDAPVNFLSDTNLRAVLTVLLARAGGSVEITNEELYDAMIPSDGIADGFVVAETTRGVKVSIQPSRREQAGSN